MKILPWILGLGAIAVAWYIYQQQTAQANNNTAQLEDEIDALSSLQTQQATSGLGLTVSGTGAAANLINSFSNLFSSAPSGDAILGSSASDDLGTTSDYFTSDDGGDDDSDFI